MMMRVVFGCLGLDVALSWSLGMVEWSGVVSAVIACCLCALVVCFRVFSFGV